MGIDLRHEVFQNLRPIEINKPPFSYCIVISYDFQILFTLEAYYRRYYIQAHDMGEGSIPFAAGIQIMNILPNSQSLKLLIAHDFIALMIYLPIIRRGGVHATLLFLAKRVVWVSQRRKGAKEWWRK